MTCVHRVKWSVKRPEDCRFRLSVSHYKDRIVAPEEYSGVTVVTPSDAEQVLPTKDKLVRDDITVNPAPTEYLSTDHNGTFVPSDGKVGFYQVDVDVNPDLRPLSVSENGSYQPDGFDGFSQVSVDVPNLLSGVLDKSISGDLYLDTEFDYLFPKMFMNCNNLRSINLPNFSGDVTGDMITGASNLEEFLVPNAKSITRATFTGTPKLKKIDIRNVTSLGGFCFRGAEMLEHPVVLLKPVEFSHTDYVAISAKEIRMCKEPTFILKGSFSRPVYNWYLGFSEERAAELGFPWGASQMKSVHYNVIFDEEGNIVSIPNT